MTDRSVRSPKLHPLDRSELLKYLLEGGSAIRDALSLKQLADGQQLNRRTLLYWRKRIRDGIPSRRSLSRNERCLNALWDILDRRQLRKAISSGSWHGTSGAERLASLLPPRERYLLQWLLTVEKEGRVPSADRRRMTLPTWQRDIRHWLDTPLIERLACCLLDHPRLIVENTLLQQIWIYITNEFSWVTNGKQQLAAEVADRLLTIWNPRNKIESLTLANFAGVTAPALSERNPIHAALDRATQNSECDALFFFPKFSLLTQHFNLRGNFESRALQYIRLVVDDARSEAADGPVPIMVLQRARTVTFLHRHVPSAGLLPEADEILDLSHPYSEGADLV